MKYYYSNEFRLNALASILLEKAQAGLWIRREDLGDFEDVWRDLYDAHEETP